MKKLLLILLMFLGLHAWATDYYVAKTGNDATGDGSIGNPWLTLTHAMDILYGSSGDTVFVRSGTYNERFTPYLIDGTASNHTVIRNYPGETPIIDGTGVTLEAGNYLVMVYSDYVDFSGFEIRGGSSANGKAMLIAIGDNITISNCKVHMCGGGIYLIGNYGVAENNEVYDACMDNSVYPGKNGYINSVGMSICHARGVGHNVIRHNYVHDVWGEGISTFEANYSTIEDNIVHDSWSTNIYTSDATYPVIRRNFVYTTYDMIGTGNDPTYRGDQVGILMGDEQYNPKSDHTTIVNNIVYHTHRNFYYWGTNNPVKGIDHLLVANNTFVNALPTPNANYAIILGNGSENNVGVEIKNNIIYQDNSVIPVLMYGNTGETWSNNLWYSVESPNVLATDETDVTDDPLFVGGDPYTDVYYKLQANSPAINAGVDVSLITDYYSHSLKGLPDIGAIEYAGILVRNSGKLMRLNGKLVRTQ